MSSAPLLIDIEKTELCMQDRELLAHPCVGGIILFSRNFVDVDQLRLLVKDIRKVKKELLISVDHEGGRVQRFRTGFSRIPPMQKLGKLFAENPQQALEYTDLMGWLMAAELLCVDIDLSYAPVLDLDESFSEIIGDRAFSSSADVVCLLASRFIQGMARAGMLACGKHFPGHGGVKADSHLELPVDKRSLSVLESTDMRPFTALLPSLAGIMPAHIVFPEVDSQPVGFSEVWIKEILRKNMAYQGLVFSDDLSMEGAAVAGSYSQRAEAALKAGCDALLLCNNRRATIEVVSYLEENIQHYSCASLQRMRGQGHLQALTDLREQKEYAQATRAIKALNAL